MKLIVPAHIVNGKVLFDEETNSNGITLDDLWENASVNIVIPPASLKSNKRYAELTAEKKQLLLSRGSHIYVRLVSSYLGVNAEKYTTEPKNNPLMPSYYKYVAVELEENLYIMFKGDYAHGSLSNCKCNIPSLKREAISVNNAYTIISQELEVGRKSHGGNVFSNCFCYIGKRKLTLESLRKRAIADKYKEKQSTEHTTRIFDPEVVEANAEAVLGLKKIKH